MGTAQPAIASSVANSVPNRDLGIAGATQQLVSQVGTTLGMNVLEAVESVSRTAGPLAGPSVAYLVGAAVAGAGVVLSLFATRGPGADRHPTTTLTVTARVPAAAGSGRTPRGCSVISWMAC